MYYEEQWVDGALCWRTSPTGAWTRYTANELAHRYESAEKRAADAQATVEALQAAANYYKQPSKNGGVYSVSGGHIGNLMDWCKDNLAHCKFSGPDEDNLDLDLVQTAQQIPQLKTELSQLQALVRALPNIEDEIMVSESFVLVEDLDMCSDMSDKREAEAYAALLRYRATLDATPTEEAT